MIVPLQPKQFLPGDARVGTPTMVCLPAATLLEATHAHRSPQGRADRDDEGNAAPLVRPRRHEADSA